jgi:hypothetical protein
VPAVVRLEQDVELRVHPVVRHVVQRDLDQHAGRPVGQPRHALLGRRPVRRGVVVVERRDARDPQPLPDREPNRLVRFEVAPFFVDAGRRRAVPVDPVAHVLDLRAPGVQVVPVPMDVRGHVLVRSLAIRLGDFRRRGVAVLHHHGHALGPLRPVVVHVLAARLAGVGRLVDAVLEVSRAREFRTGVPHLGRLAATSLKRVRRLAQLHLEVLDDRREYHLGLALHVQLGVVEVRARQPVLAEQAEARRPRTFAVLVSVPVQVPFAAVRRRRRLELG